MSASDSAAVDAIAFQLLAALDAYESDTAAMVAAWPDLERYTTVSGQVEKVRMYCTTRAELRVQWVELLIAHAELIHHLWSAQHGSGVALREQLAQPLANHSQAIASLRRRCRSEAGGRH